MNTDKHLICSSADRRGRWWRRGRWAADWRELLLHTST